jgi:hypothetical protein
MQFVENKMVLAHVDALMSILEILMKAVVLSVLLILIVHQTWLVFEINVKIPAQEHVVKMLIVKLLTIYHCVLVELVTLEIHLIIAV